MKSGRRPAGKLLLSCAALLLAGSLVGEVLPDSPQAPAPAAKLPSNLDPLTRSYPSRVQTALNALKSGVDEFQAGRNAGAVTRLPELSEAELTAVPDYALSYRAKANLALEKAEAALNDFRLLISRYPSSPQRNDAVIGEAKALISLNRPKEALSALQRPGLAETEDVLQLRARAHELSGETQAAVALYLRLYTDFAASKASLAAGQRLEALSPRTLSPGSGYLTILKRAQNLAEAGRYSDVRGLMLTIGKVRAPSPADYEMRNLLLGEAEFHLGRSVQALTHLKDVTTLNAEAHARALYLQGAAYRRLKREESFLSSRGTALRLYPESPFTEKLLYSVATYYDVDNRTEEATAAYREIANRFPTGDYAQRAGWKLALLSYGNRNYKEALHAYWNYLVRYPEPGNVGASAYWMGRCYEKLGDHQRGIFLYGKSAAFGNSSYYGQRALESLKELRSNGVPGKPYEGIAFDQVKRLLDGIAPPSSVIPEPSRDAARIIERARQLQSAGLSELAVRELRWGIQTLPDHRAALSYLLSRVYESNGDYFSVITTLRRAFPNYDSYPYHSLPEEVWEMFFPVRHLKDISRQAEKNSLDPALVLSVIRQESAFQETARSHANARGLMQILPSTGRSLAGKAGVAPYSTARLYRAGTNIALGTHHLSSLVERYDRRLELALAAYNAGATRVDRWRRELGDVEMDEFVEQIPFSETRGYVKQVLTNLAHYRRIASSSQNSAH